MLRYYATVRPVAIYFNMLNATGNCTSLRRCACSCAVDPHPRAPSPPAQPPLPPALPLPETSSPLPEHGRSNLSSAALRGVVFAAAVGVGCLALLLLRLITWLRWGGCQRSKATITTRHVALHECGFASAAPQRPSSTSPDHVASTAPSSTSPGYLSQVELTPVDTLSISSDCSSSDASAPADAPPAGSRSFEIDSFAGARVDLERKIGEGGFAAVWLAVHEVRCATRRRDHLFSCVLLSSLTGAACRLHAAYMPLTCRLHAACMPLTCRSLSATARHTLALSCVSLPCI